MKSTLLNMTAVLFGITLVASAGVGFVNMITVEPIAAAKEAATLAALNEVLPAFDATTTEELTIDDMPITVYTATAGGSVSGYAVQSMTKQGFGGVVRLMVGFTPEGEVVNVNVLEQTETPGLGTKMADEGNVLLASVKGRNRIEEARRRQAGRDEGWRRRRCADRRNDLVARLCRRDQPRVDGLQERGDGRSPDRHGVRSDGRRRTNQRACGSGRRSK